MERLDWVDGYIDRIRAYIHVRPEDRLLIKRPNRAYRMNESGIQILDRLVNGRERVCDIVTTLQGREDVIADLDVFFRDLRCLLTHGLPDRYESPAVKKIPFDHHFSKLPVLSEIAVTYRCNLACQFCYAGCNCTKTPTNSQQEMPLEAIKRVLEIIWHDAKVPSVSFTGGEPTLRRDLAEMVAYAKGLGLRVNLITNGTNCSADLTAALADAGLDSAQVSVEGTNASIHDAVTCVKGSFTRSLDAVRNFQKTGLIVHINTTINRLNSKDAPGMPKLARSLGLERLSMNMTIPTGSSTKHPNLEIEYREIGPIVDAIHRAAKQEGVEFMWYSPTPLCLFNPISRGLGNKGCAACDGLLSIGADGNVLPCSSYDEPLGNILELGFHAIWQGARARYFREKEFAPEHCHECDSFSACQSGCPLYWRAKGFDELPFFATANGAAT